MVSIGMSTIVVNKAVFDDIGIFDESFQACEDYDFVLRATQKYEVKLINEALTVKYGGHFDQLSSTVWGLDRFRINAMNKILSENILDQQDSKETIRE